jgi:hypothetical protein
MRPFTRPVVLALLVVPALLAVLAAPAAAKEWLQATLDAPIAMDTPPGTEILVGVTVMVPGDDGAMHPVEGSPIRLILTGRDGSTTHAAGAADGTPGHYLMRITIPAGGVRAAQVAMHGTSDLPLTLTADPLTFGGVTARTAQVAPPLAPPMTPLPRASAGAAAPAAPVEVAAPVERSSAAAPIAPASDAFPLLLGAGVAVLTLVLAIGLLVAARRSGGGRRVDGAAGRTPGA